MAQRFSEFELRLDAVHGVHSRSADGHEASGQWVDADLLAIGPLAANVFTAGGSPKRLGDAMERLAFPGRVAEHFATAWQLARRNPSVLRVRLRLDATLAPLPWEFLRFRDRWLATHADFVLARHVARAVGGRPPDQLPDRPKILVASGSQQEGPIQAGAIHELLSTRHFEVLDLLEDCELRDLDQALVRDRPHILHLIAHGRVRDGQGEIALSHRGDSTHWHAADQLATVFDRWQPELVLLHTCDSAARPRGEASDGEQRVSITDAMAAKGPLRVVGMSAPISNEVAVAFSNEFYRELTRTGASIEYAVQLARRGLGREFGFTRPWFGVANLLLSGAAEHTPAPETGPQDQVASQAPRVRHNLRQRDYATFVGRDRELRQLGNLLPPDSSCPVIGVFGPAGSGKSTLALEIVHRVIEAPKPAFDTVIWVSAQTQVLTRAGVQPHSHVNALEDVLQSTALTMGRSELLRLPVPEQVERLRLAMVDQPVLIVIDNFETVDDHRVLEFVSELPAPTRVLLTSREFVECSDHIRLGPMGESEAIRLLELELSRRGIQQSREQNERLAAASNALPLIIKWVVGHLAAGHAPGSVLAKLASGADDLAAYCFGTSVESLRMRNHDAYQSLISASVFAGSMSREAFGEVAALDSPHVRDECIATLLGMNLLEQTGERLRMLPVIKRLILKLVGDMHELAEPRTRQVAYYLRFLKKYNPKQDSTPETEPFWQEVHNIRALIRALQTERADEDAEGADKDYVKLCVEYSSFVWVHGLWAELFEIAQSIAASGRKTGDWEAVAKVALDAALAYMDRFDADAMREQLTLVLEMFEHLDRIPPQLYETFLFCRAAAAAIRRDAAAQQYFEEDLEFIESIGERWRKAGTLWWMGAFNARQGRWEDAQRYFDQAMEISESAGDRRTMALVYGWRPAALYFLGRKNDAFGSIAELEGFVQRYGQLTSKGQLADSAAIIHLAEGLAHLQSGLAYAEAAHGVFRDLGRKELAAHYEAVVPALHEIVTRLAELQRKEPTNGST
ncbi:CHAT domain-containing protein [Nonomuraea sp. B1E8]|uniref:CHAT domain-containing protein n=1 Tax=unclassified Nonomuraea TaxID=2593643 RepID=UPI00325D7862